MKSNKKILVVENEYLIRNSLVIVLQDIIYKSNIFGAKDGLEGLESFKENAPDIIITDIMMPHMDGIEMVGKIREIDKDVIIIIISAYKKELYEMIKLYDIKGYFLKPFLNTKLKHFVQGCL